MQDDSYYFNRVISNTRYETLPNYKLFSLPVSTLSSDEGAIIAIWVTNKQKFYQFVKDSLFPKWQVTYLATWYWIKVTNCGELVVDINSTHRKPFEPLIIGYCKGKSGTCKADIDTFLKSTKFSKEIQVFCSIPGMHSRKPPLKGLLEACLPKDPSCLELFARNLAPGFTSWGNEVLYFQQKQYFEEKARVPNEDSANSCGKLDE